MAHITQAATDADIERCEPVMRELRPHIPAGEFLARIRRQEKDGFRLAFVEDGGAVKAVAGYRIFETLAWGKILYVDDLVTSERERSKGHGDRLINWLVAEARKHGCDQFHLDSAVHRFGAHRFYLRKRMDISCHHFSMKI
jgi:GNAT superfamily N-acetyltransferase